jgi:hypothetical protein
MIAEVELEQRSFDGRHDLSWNFVARSDWPVRMWMDVAFAGHGTSFSIR